MTDKRQRTSKPKQRPVEKPDTVDSPQKRIYFDPSKMSVDEIARRIWDSRKR